MSEHEYYRLDLVVGVSGDEQAKGKLKAMDKFVEQTRKRGELLNRLKMSPAVQLIDRISAPIRKIEANLGRLTRSTKKITIEAVDKTTGVIKKIAGALTSPLALLGAGAGVYGIGKLTLGAAMDFETQMVGMEHWLKGNKKAAQEFTDWLDILAAKTPFEMGDLFPAASRAVGVSEGDVGMAQRLVKLATDMAGLTPGKTVRDAMEALADAQMGEFERMKEFNMKLTKEEMNAAGGFFGVMSQIESKFAGGAEKLSATASGGISTMTDFAKTQFRSLGQGMLEAMSPRLKKISDWFDKNPETVRRWREQLIRFGREAFEGILSWGERFFGGLMAKFEDPGFQQLDWKGKLSALLDDVEDVVIPQAARVAGKLGSEFGKTFASGVIEAIESDKRVALMVGVWAGLSVPGTPQVKAAAAAAIISMPYLKDAGAEVANPIAEFGNRWEVRKSAGFLGVPDKQALIEKLNAGNNATGTDYWRGGLTWVGERGPELVNLPRGSQVIPNNKLVGGGINLNVQADVDVSLGGGDIDYNTLANAIGWRIATSIKQTLENRG